MTSRAFRTSSEAETSAVGEELARSLRPGDVILLHGELGAGKTAFVRGLARGLGAPAEEVSSPTFTLIQEYQGETKLYHVDLYRLEPGEVEDLGLDELANDAVVAVEWAERWRDRPRAARIVSIEDLGEDRREIVITSVGSDPGG